MENIPHCERDGFNGFDGKTEGTFGSTLISVFGLIDFLSSESAVQFSVKCVKYVHFFAHFLTFVALCGLHQKGGFLNIFTAVWRCGVFGQRLPIYEVIIFCLQL